MTKNSKTVIALIALVVGGIFGAQQVASDGPDTDTKSAETAPLVGNDTSGSQIATGDSVPSSASDEPRASDEPSESERFSDLPPIDMQDLTPEAIETLHRIDTNAEHPYRADGSIFQNRERLLPLRERGHYREYTVDTPGSPDRGARRIVAGADGERYYTSDHYASFREIER